MKEMILKVDGMACSGCENRIQKALKNIEGVEEVTANHETGKVTVTLQEKIEESLIEKTIENLGYEVIKED